MRKEFGDAVTEVTVRVYGSLNDFLPPQRRQIAWPHVVGRRQSVKDLIESLGVPHPEIDLILANGISVPFDYAVQSADRIAVYPRFTNVDIGTLTHVRPPPPDTVRFVVDVHLGKLARRLRLIGLDTAYRPDANDAELAELADRERRILLTRDQGLLKPPPRSTRIFCARDTSPPSARGSIAAIWPARPAAILSLPSLQRRAPRSPEVGDRRGAPAPDQATLGPVPGLRRLQPHLLEGISLGAADARD